MSSKKLTTRQEQAALLLAQAYLTIEQVAERVGVTRQALHLWRKNPRFTAAVEAETGRIRQEIRSRGIAITENRVASLQDRHDRLNRVMAERAEDPTMANVPGGTTGLMVRNVKSIGSGENAERVELFEVDTGLLRELREHEKQAAQELGQWTEKQDHTTDGKPLVVKILNGVTMNDL